MLNIIIKEMKEIYADKRILIGILTVLIIIIIGTSYNIKNSNTEPSEHLKLGVINNDDSTYSDILLTYFNSSETFSSLITVITGDSGAIKRAFDRGELDIFLEIPEDFAGNMMHLEHAPIQVTINIEDTTKAILFQNVLKSYEKYIAAVEANAVGLYEIMQRDGMDPKLIDDTNRSVSIDLILTALGKESFFSYQPVERFPTTTLVEYYIGSLLVLALLYSGLYTGFQVIREMKQGTFTRLRTTRTPIYQLLTAKMVLLIILFTIITSVALSVISGKLVVMEGILFSLAISMFCISQAVLISVLFNTTQRFVLVGNLMIFYFTIIGGGIIPIQFLPQNMVFLSKITPNYYMLRGIIDLNLGQLQLVNQITIGFLLLSCFLYGITVLLFEQRSVSYEEA
ncbi:MAG: ABC transporter permease [Mobilitalea sp.]